MMVTLDPSLRATGMALWWGTRLVGVGLVPTSLEVHGRGPSAWAYIAERVYEMYWGQHRQVDGQLQWGMCAAPTCIATEYPVIYEHKARGKGKAARPKDLMEVSGAVGAAVGALSATLPEVKGYLPAEWKGTIKKAVMTKRIVKRLRPNEKAILDAWRSSYTGEIALKDDVEDAIGVGLWTLRRL